MLFHEGLSTAEASAIFAEEIQAAGGHVSDKFDDGRRLFVRSILPWVKEVRARDGVQGGVALRATEHELSVHPYVFRKVCSNGAIMAQAIQSQHIDEFASLSAPEATWAVRSAVQACCAEEAFTVAVGQMRWAAQNELDMALNLL